MKLVSKMLVVVSLLISNWLFVNAESAIQLEINPPAIEIDFTNELVVECSVFDNNVPGGLHVVSIIISRTNQTSEEGFIELASISDFSNFALEISPDNATIKGVINGSYQSYLRMSWTNPSYNKAGLYKCEATGIDAIGHRYSYVSISKVHAEEVDSERFLPEMKAFLQTHEVIASLDNLGKSLLQRLENSKQAYFDVSTTFNGSSYFLSNNRHEVTPTKCQATCQMYGGYLAEMNSEAEFTFIRDFIGNLKNKIYIHLILIGGSDEGHEGIWISTNTNLTIEYLEFLPSNYVGSPNDNCIYLNSNFDWKMDDLPCLLYKSYFPRFICEFPIN